MEKLIILIEAGADLNSVKDEEGLSAIAAATKKGRCDLVEVLLSNGAAVNHPDLNGLTPNMYDSECREILQNAWNDLQTDAEYDIWRVWKEV